MSTIAHKNLTGTDLHSMTTDGSTNPTNILSHGDFDYWTNGAAYAPDSWTLSGSGASVAREGTIIKLGTYSVKVTRSGADCNIYQYGHTERGINYWKGRTVSLGCWVYATVASTTRVSISDAVDATYSSYHTGNSIWQWLSLTHTMNASATRMQISLEVNTTNTSGYFDGAIAVEGNSVFSFSSKPLGNPTIVPGSGFTLKTTQYVGVYIDGVYYKIALIN
jgi:hypothetical protein